MIKKSKVHIAFIVVLLVGGCGTSPGFNYLSKKEVLVEKQINIGMTEGDAMLALQQIGFKCRLEENSNLGYRVNPNDSSHAYLENVTYIRGWATKKAVITKTVLTVKLLLHEGKVAKVYFDWQRDGL